MERAEMIEAVKAEMPERRWIHTEGVMATSILLAKRFGGDPERAELAALLHDVAKFWAIDRQAAVIADNGLGVELLAYEKELWHAPVGAWEAGTRFGVDDEDVLNAIRYHTSGRRGMSKLEKIVWLADYIEPGRDFPGINEIRSLSEKNLDIAILAALDATIGVLISRGKLIYPLTVEARNDILKSINKEQPTQ
ncbi:bis(5'-nucleosyl)-tetraphosphatase (symmetrical) YqeK [Paenibacillus sp. CAU 1782]